tara:strand:- start:848 stop:3475 length:2628 start_codon:yes stop_codon:yes gene_type:complete
MINNDIESILECLEKQGYDIKLGKDEMAKIIKNYLDKKNSENVINEEEYEEVRIDIHNNEMEEESRIDDNEIDEEKINNEKELFISKDCEELNFNTEEELKFNRDMNQELENYLNNSSNNDIIDNSIEESNIEESNIPEKESENINEVNKENLNKDLEELIKETENKLNDELNKVLNKKEVSSSDYLYDLLKIKKGPENKENKFDNTYRFNVDELKNNKTNIFDRTSDVSDNKEASRNNYNNSGYNYNNSGYNYKESVNRFNNRFSSRLNDNRTNLHNRFGPGLGSYGYNAPSLYNNQYYRQEYEIPNRYTYNYNRFGTGLPNKGAYDIHNRIMDERMRDDMLREERMREERMREERMREDRMREERIREERMIEERLREDRMREEGMIDDKMRYGAAEKPIVKDYIYIQDDGSKPMVEILGQNLLNEIDGLKNDILTYEIHHDPNQKLSLRNIFDKFKDKKKVVIKYDKEEKHYYDGLDDKKKDKIDKLEDKISKLNNIIVPLRFRVLESNLPLHNKAMIINKIEDLFANKFMGGSEITKYSNWVNSALKIPFKKYKKLPLDIDNSNNSDIGNYLVDVKKTLDTAVYGHTNTKEQIIQIIAQWITNPVSTGNCIGIEGVMGNGKTTLVKNGIAKAIDRPFAFITLGGCSDASFLEGHNYTYEGSMWGKIVDVLIQCKCMNPVFYFDELDKVSETPKGEEIINTLIHLTDASQNSQFSDKYFNGIPLDLSKSLFIFSYNDKSKINPILLDRLICIKTDDFKTEDKIEIAKNYLLKDIYSQLTIKDDLYKLSDENLKYIIDTYTEEGGVRTLKKHLFAIFSKLNLLKLTKHDENIKYTFDLDKSLLESNEIDQKKIDLLIGSKDKDKDEYYKTFYM